MLYSYYALSSLADSLLEGEGNLLEKLVTDRIQEVGKLWLKEKVDQVVGHDFARRVKRGWTTGGMSEVRRLRNSWLGGSAFSARSGIVGRTMRAFDTGFISEFNRRETKVSGSDVRRAVVDRIEAALFGEGHGAGSTEGQESNQGKRRNWSGSRQQWLNAAWRHDWRSQPRDFYGRWSPGRLNHPYMSKGARRIRRQRIAAARKTVHETFLRNQT